MPRVAQQPRRSKSWKPSIGHIAYPVLPEEPVIPNLDLPTEGLGEEEVERIPDVLVSPCRRDVLISPCRCR